MAIHVFVIHGVALLSPAHSPFCQLQLLHFYPLHQNMKSVDLDFFGLSLTWGRMGPSSRGEAQSCTPRASHTPCPLKVLPQPAGLPEAAAGTALARMGHGANAIFDSRGSSHQAQPRQKVWQGTQGSRTRAGLLSRTIPPVEQFPISPFHQHQVIQFQFCTSWVYLARRETSSLLSSC